MYVAYVLAARARRDSGQATWIVGQSFACIELYVSVWPSRARATRSTKPSLQASADILDVQWMRFYSLYISCPDSLELPLQRFEGSFIPSVPYQPSLFSVYRWQ